MKQPYFRLYGGWTACPFTNQSSFVEQAHTHTHTHTHTHNTYTHTLALSLAPVQLLHQAASRAMRGGSPSPLSTGAACTPRRLRRQRNSARRGYALSIAVQFCGVPPPLLRTPLRLLFVAALSRERGAGTPSDSKPRTESKA